MSDHPTIGVMSTSSGAGTTMTAGDFVLPAMIAPHRVGRAPLTWVRERARCFCGGEMVSTGHGVTGGMGVIRSLHRCTTCGAVAAFAHTYPRDVAVEKAL